VGLRGGCNSMVEYQVVVLRVEGSNPSLRPLKFYWYWGSSSVVEHEPVALGVASSNLVFLVCNGIWDIAKW
jgi:hypothetical protein